MKILFTTEQYYPVISGVSSVVTAMAEALVPLGHNVNVVTGYKQRQSSVHNGVKIFEFKIKGGFGNYYRGETQQYINFILEQNYDVIINECVQTWTTDLLLPYLSQIKAKKILHSHGFSLLSYQTKNPWAYLKTKYYYHFLHQYLRAYDHLFFLHEETVETIYCKQYHISHFSYLSNGVDKSFISSKKLNQKEDRFLLNISNYFPMKNQEYLLQAYYKAKTKAKLIFIGTEILHDYLDYLKQQKEKFDKVYGYKEVLFLHKINRKETLTYLENATLFLHSSKLEVFPMVILEAMAKGVPFLSTDVGNVKELKGGVVVHSQEEMSQWIDRLLEDKSLYEKLTHDAMDILQSRYTWERIIQRLLDVL